MVGSMASSRMPRSAEDASTVPKASLLESMASSAILAMRIARKTMRIVWQNIVFALGVKVLILVLAAVGIANMWLAVFGDVGVAILAILNAMRCMSVKKMSE